MKTLLIISMLFGMLLADCDYNCTCPEIDKLLSGDPSRMSYDKGIGCSQSLNCTSKTHVVSFNKDLSNVPFIAEINLASLNDINTPVGELPILTKDYFTEFGFVCEDGNWFVTKFPMGFDYGGHFTPEMTNGKGYRIGINYLACS